MTRKAATRNAERGNAVVSQVLTGAVTGEFKSSNRGHKSQPSPCPLPSWGPWALLSSATQGLGDLQYSARSLQRCTVLVFATGRYSYCTPCPRGILFELGSPIYPTVLYSESSCDSYLFRIPHRYFWARRVSEPKITRYIRCPGVSNPRHNAVHFIGIRK